MQSLPLKPWYREPWPWILMAGPAAVIVAGVVTAVLAVRSFDGLVAEDYYKQGLAVNQVLARAGRAKTLGIEGRITLVAEADGAGGAGGAGGADGTGGAGAAAGVGGAARVDLRGIEGSHRAGLKLSLSHPTRAGLDQHLTLVTASAGTYVGRVAPLVPGRWNVILEDTAATWRIRGELRIPSERTAELR